MQSLTNLLNWAKRHGWLTLLAMVGLIAAFPVAYSTTRLILLLCVVSLWLWGVILVRRRKLVVSLAVMLPIAFVLWLSFPGHPADPAALRREYVQCLQGYKGSLYVWGGENRIGIDCSGLVRRGLINANVRLGVITLNPRLFRNAMSLWWNDCSARALRDEYRGLTTRLSNATSINSIAEGSILPGDLAITANGVHVLAYLGGTTWIEADPDELRVITVDTPSKNMWFTTPVQVVRWSQIKEPPNNCVRATPLPRRT